MGRLAAIGLAIVIGAFPTAGARAVLGDSNDLGKTTPKIEEVREEVRRNTGVIVSRSADDPPDSARNAAAAIWKSLGIWIARYLDAHPSADAQSIETLVASLGPISGSPTVSCPPTKAEFERQPQSENDIFAFEKCRYPHASVLRFGNAATDSLLVTLRVENLGNVLLFAHDKATGTFRPVWDVTDALGNSNDSAWAKNAPYVVPQNLFRFSDSASGTPRFMIEARPFQFAGCCGGRDISIWEIGESGTPKLLRSVSFAVRNFEDLPPVAVQGDLIDLQEMSPLKVLGFSACGGPEAKRRIEITPDGLIDHGWVPTNPIPPLVDDLFDQVIHDRPLSVPIDPKRVKALRACLPSNGYLHDIRFDVQPEPSGAKRVRVDADGLRCEIQLRIEERSGKPFVASVM